MTVNDKSVLRALLFQFTMIVVFISIAIVFELTDQNHTCEFTLSYYFHFGPSDNLCFVSIRINTWWKWIIILLLTVVIDAVATLSAELFSPWLSNVLADPDGPPTSSYMAHLIQQVYYVNYYLQNAIWTFVSLTQVDLLLFSMLSSNTVCFFTTRRYLKQKNRFFVIT
jgi:hypothetical protein